MNSRQETTYPNEAFHLAGHALAKGDTKRAIILFRAHLATHPSDLNALHDLGVALDRNGDKEEAVSCFISVINAQPNCITAYLNLGAVLECLGNETAAQYVYSQATKVSPKSPTPHVRLGRIAQLKGNWDDSLHHFTNALELSPFDPVAQLGLADSYREKGALRQAETLYRRLIERSPPVEEAYLGLGILKHREGELETATKLLRKATRNSNLRERALSALSFVYREKGEPEACISTLKAIRIQNPHALEALVDECLTLPIVYTTEAEIHTWRKRYKEGLKYLDEVFGRGDYPPEDWLHPLITHSNFYLQYQGRNDRVLQRTYASLVERAVQQRSQSKVLKDTSPRRPFKIGFLSSHFRLHSVGRLMLGFLHQLRNHGFQVHSYQIGPHADHMTRMFSEYSNHFSRLPLNLDVIVNVVRQARLHIAFFGDIGMEPLMTGVAAAKVAPIQCVYWGHPVTTGLSTMDVFVSSDEMEPHDATKHYTEKLVRLGGLGTNYSPLHAGGHDPAAPRISLPEGSLLLSPHSLYKYLPQYDHLYARIAKAHPDIKLVFVSHHRSRELTAQLIERLHNAFNEQGISPRNRLFFLPRLTPREFSEIHSRVAAVLDAPGWSGGNTAFDALAQGCPIVTLPGPLMRMRHSAAMLRRIGLDELVCHSEEEYVEQALRLAKSPPDRSRISRHITKESKDKIFNQSTAALDLVKAFEHIISTRLK